ncbi:MAG: hypothetical protein AAF587_17745 [Bacteroidota bacterium]
MKNQQSQQQQAYSKANAWQVERESQHGVSMAPPSLQLLTDQAGLVIQHKGKKPLTREQKINRAVSWAANPSLIESTNRNTFYKKLVPSKESIEQLQNHLDIPSSGQYDLVTAEAVLSKQEAIKLKHQNGKANRPFFKKIGLPFMPDPAHFSSNLELDREGETYNSGQRMLELMDEKKEEDLIYWFYKPFKKSLMKQIMAGEPGKYGTKKEKNDLVKRIKTHTLTAEEEKYVDTEQEKGIYAKNRNEVYARVGNENLKKPRGTTNCSIVVSEVLYDFLGGNKGAIDGVSIQDEQFHVLVEKFQTKEWISALEESGIGYQVEDVEQGLQPGDILSSEGHRVLFRSYIYTENGEQKKDKEGNPKAKIVEANLTSKKQLQKAIKNRTISIKKNIHTAARLYDFKEPQEAAPFINGMSEVSQKKQGS